MKIIKKVKNQESKKRLNVVDFKSTKTIMWNNKRRFSLQEKKINKLFELIKKSDSQTYRFFIQVKT